MNTLSTSDYTVEVQISEQMWDHFMHNYYDPDNQFSSISQFRLYIKNDFEQRIAMIPSAKYNNSKVSADHNKISIVQFAYNNYDIIN